MLNAWRLTMLKDKLDRMNKRCVKEEEQLAVHRSARLCNLVYLFFLVTYASFGILSVFPAVLKGRTPWRIYIPYFDWRVSTSNLMIASSFEFLCMGSALSLNHLNDAYPLVFGLVIRLNIDLLKKRIQNLRTDPCKCEEQNYEDLKNCIDDHKQILDACNLIRPCLSQIICMQFLFVGVLYGITMMNLMFFVNFWTGISCMIYFFGIICQTFPFCYICTLIDSDCDDLALSIFSSNWQDASPRYKSTLRHFLHHAQQNITFTAGGIFPISLNTNISLAKMAFSVVTFVKQMKILDSLNDK
ncbi:odorant receptor 59b-like [Drosophila innubila]|uniref:odorant receptor 59b-like n=1 Tax=Drosophila innubila TaxID=198719 RepID=UPI00148C46FD|nr:odorant receptor 59b-like [Drosophila innubila]